MNTPPWGTITKSTQPRRLPALDSGPDAQLPRTRAYVARRTAEGKTIREIHRCLKRYIARELYRDLQGSGAFRNCLFCRVCE